MLSVLVISPHPSVPGGVSVFIECMKRHVAQSRIDSFFIGGTGKRESVLAQMIRLVTAPVRLARLVRRQKFDVVHINPSFTAKAMIRDGLMLLALRLIGYRRTLFYIHGWDVGMQRRILGNRLLRFVTAWIINGAGVVTVLAADFRDALVAMGVDPSRIVLTRTMFEGNALRAVKDETRDVQRRFILFMSRFDREKGARELVSAFAALAPHYADLDLVLAGSGADEDFLRARIREAKLEQRVRFTGYVGGQDKARLLRDCAVFALPTFYRSEGMPLAVLEAMGAAKPVLVGAAGALRSILSDPDNGVVLDKVTEQAVEAGLRRLLDDENFAATAGERNAQMAWAVFEAHAVTAGIEQLYRRVASC